MSTSFCNNSPRLYRQQTVWFFYMFVATRPQKPLVVSPPLSPHLVHLASLVNPKQLQKYRGAPLLCRVPLLLLRLRCLLPSPLGVLNSTELLPLKDLFMAWQIPSKSLDKSLANSEQDTGVL